MRTTPLCDTTTASVANTGTTSSAIDVRQYKSGMVNFPADFNTDTISFTHCDTIDGTYAALGGSVSMTAATGWMALPAAVFSGFFIKMVTNNAVTADRTLTFVFKS